MIYSGVILIRFITSKFFIFVCTFVIGVITFLFGVIKFNHAYATVGDTEEYDAANIVPFYWLILIIGGIILITLSYVSFRKYRGHKKANQKRDTNN